ncbi:MAG TPA: DUF4270 domain-containing protein [Bacteroidales bacterium]|nr:DUF4270 domain-containing protein [Bacteroidales bacterium]HPT02056.1 DUF4270 domain-containing protein [Bacteroidales bacterium]
MKLFRNAFLYLILASPAVLFTTCTKDPDLVGLNLVSPSELLKLGYTDTAQIVAYTVKVDTVSTQKLTYALIGSMNDPVFGQTDATFYSQILLVDEGSDYGTSPVFDSAYLVLPYHGVYGDTMSNMTFRIYELTQPLDATDTMYSFNTVPYDESHLLGSLTFVPRPHDSVYIDGTKTAPSLRIPLTEYFGQRMLSISADSLDDNDSFLNCFYGICIVAEKQETPGKGSILYFTVPSSKSMITLNYHNTEDTTKAYYIINTNCMRFGNYSHNGYSSASPLLQQQFSGDTTVGNQYLFLQSMGGCRVRLRFPSVPDWQSKHHLIVNDAQLIFTNASPGSQYTEPASLALMQIDDDNVSIGDYLDDQLESSTYFDGNYNETDHTYRFRVTRYIQQLMTGKVENNGLYLIISGAAINSDRLILNGPQNPYGKLKLFVKYTVLD